MNYINAYYDYKYNSNAIEVIEIHKKMLLNEKLSRDKIYNDFLNPQLTSDNMDLYIVRKSILNTLNSNMHQFNGILLDLGCGEMPYKNYILSNSKVEKYIGLDIENPTYQQNTKPDLFWNGTEIPLEDNSVNCVVATEFFEHVPYPDKILNEVRRVLKHDGMLFITVPFIWPLHTMPYDEYRYTPFSLERILKNSGFGDINIKSLGGWDASFAQVMGLWIRRRPMTNEMRNTYAQTFFELYKSLIESDEIPNHFNDSMLIIGLTATAKKKVISDFVYAKNKYDTPNESNMTKSIIENEFVNKNVLAIVCPQVGAISETFIRKHIEFLSPGRTVILTGNVLDKSWFNGPLKIIPIELGKYSFDKKTENEVTRFFADHSVTHILCEFGCIGGAVVELNQREMHLPVFVHFHGQDASEFIRRKEIAEYYRWMGNVVNGVITVSKPMAARLINVGIPEDKIKIIHYGVVYNSESKVKQEKNVCCFISVSRLVGKKGIRFVLQAFEKAKKSAPGITLDIIGEGPLRSEIELFIKEHFLSDSITLHGEQPHSYVLNMMNESSVFVQHSIVDPETGNAEGLPLSILEASAHGLPVISTFHEGIPEAIEHLQTGLLVNEGEWELMADYMVILANDLELRKQMGISGRKKILNGGFTVDAMLVKLKEFIGLDNKFKSSNDIQNISTPAGFKRVLFVNHNVYPYELSGTPISTLNHAVGIKKKGIEVAILIPSTEVQRDFVKEITDGIVLYKVPHLDKYETFFMDTDETILNKYTYSIEKIINEFRPDIVHINDYVFMPDEIVSLFSKSGAYVIRNVCNPEEICHLDSPVYFDGIKDVLCSGPETPEKCSECFLINVLKKNKDEILQSEIDEYSGKIKKRFESIHSHYSKDVDGVIFTERTFKNYFNQFIPLTDESTKINPRGFKFDVPRISNYKKSRNGIIHIGYLGSLISRKGIDLILRAFDKISYLENFVLDIYGSDTTKSYLDLIDQLEEKHPGKIKFHGNYENSNLPEIANSLDFALVPSNFDTFNRVVRELMYFGVPLIVTDFFGSSIIENNVNGIKIKIGDESALADTIKYLLLNPSVIEELSKGVVKTPITSINDEIDGIYNFYKYILNKKGLKQKVKCRYEKILEAESLIERNEIETAKLLLQNVLMFDNNNIDALNDLAVVCIMTEEYKEALKHIQGILSIEPSNEVALGNREYIKQQSVNHTPVEIEVNTFSSYDDFKNYSLAKENLFKERALYEKNLVEEEETYTIPGYCKVCESDSNFLVDYLYACQNNGTKIPNWRERLVCPKCGLNNRMRAAIHLLKTVTKPKPDARIYISEQTTQLYQYFLKYYPNTVGSEYLGEKYKPGEINESGIRNENFTNLTFLDKEFDLILSFEVFEHIPDFITAFSESLRVLKPGGYLIFTVPFITNSKSNLVRAVITNGIVEHIHPPEYHGDPVNSSEGCLCYYHFGWEVLEQLKTAGFENVSAMSFYSKEFGYLGGEQLFFVAEKSKIENSLNEENEGLNQKNLIAEII